MIVIIFTYTLIVTLYVEFYVVFNFVFCFFFVYIISSCLVVALMTFVARCYLAKN